MSTTKDKISVMQHFENGGKVQKLFSQSQGAWRDDKNPSWDWDYYKYRIKPEPREWWVNEYPTHITSSNCATNEAAKAIAIHGCIGQIKVREVLE